VGRVSEDTTVVRDVGAAGSPMPVPAVLRDVTSWVWRLLVLALAAYLLVDLANRLAFIVLPFFAAMFATSLGYPVVRFLRNHGFRPLVATWLTVLVAAMVLVGVAIFVVDRAVNEYPDLVTQVSAAVTKFRHFLTVDLHLKSSSTSSIGNTITNYLTKHESAVASGALTGITTVAEILGGALLWFFMTFFLLYDGERIWEWVVGLFPARARPRVLGAGIEAWDRLSGFTRGTFVIAVIHGVVTAVTLTILGVPLVAPLSVLVFLGSFIPIVGSITFGALAVAVTLVTQGLVPGIVLTGVLVLDNQFEAHYLQPILVGRYVRLHPLAVAIAIAAGGVLEGIAGAIIAVPTVAVIYAIVRYLATGEQQAVRAGPGPMLMEQETPAGAAESVLGDATVQDDSGGSGTVDDSDPDDHIE
jgi:putative heme transporter